MTFIQRFFMTILPQTLADKMQVESKSWRLKCPCGFERSVWDLGGIRYKAKGNPHKRTRCPTCQQVTWHQMYQKSEIKEDA